MCVPQPLHDDRRPPPEHNNARSGQQPALRPPGAAVALHLVRSNLRRERGVRSQLQRAGVRGEHDQLAPFDDTDGGAGAGGVAVEYAVSGKGVLRAGVLGLQQDED